MPFPSKDLADLADQMFPQPGGTDLSDAGWASRKLRDTVTHSEERTRPFVASIFWQAFLITPSFRFFLDGLTRDHPRLRIKLTQVVPHGQPFGDTRFDLLILAHGLDDDLYFTTEAKPLDDELKNASDRYVAGLRQSGEHYKFLDMIDHGSVAVEALHAHSFGIVLFPAPPMVPTAYVRSSAIDIVEPSTGAASTAGVRCVNGNKQAGVTAAWHAVKDCVGGVIQVDGRPGKLVGGGDILSDSAFIEVALPAAAGDTQAPCLTNLVPRPHEPVTFIGHASGLRRGKITGFSPQLPAVSRNAQLVVTTDPISAPGDSGAALRDGQGLILGCCHETSQFGAANPYTSWIWAESVFKAHDLS